MSNLGGSRASSLVLVLGACVTVGCGGGDEGGGDGKPDCGTASSPDPFVIANVTPAPGASVPNANIVHTFKIVGNVYAPSLALAMPATHTAGLPTPNPTMWALAAESDGMLYTATPITWMTAPGHVEVQLAGAYADPDGCVFAFPSPMFSYDITAP
jgi:hypothetical protein